MAITSYHMRMNKKTDKSKYTDEDIKLLNYFASQLTKVKNEKNLNGNKIANMMGVSRAHVHAWENSIHFITFRHLVTLCEVLEKDVNYFIPDSLHSFYVIRDTAMEPRFPVGTQIYIDQNIDPRPGDYIIVECPMFDPIFRRYDEIFGKKYLCSLNNMPSMELASNMTIMGVAIKAVISLADNPNNV